MNIFLYPKALRKLKNKTSPQPLSTFPAAIRMRIKVYLKISYHKISDLME